MNQNKQIDFKCRICGHTEYGEVSQDNGVIGKGYSSWRIYCYCKKCTVCFSDPKAFSADDHEKDDRAEIKKE